MKPIIYCLPPRAKHADLDEMNDCLNREQRTVFPHGCERPNQHKMQDKSIQDAS